MIHVEVFKENYHQDCRQLILIFRQFSPNFLELGRTGSILSYIILWLCICIYIYIYSGGYRILLRGGTKRARSAQKIFCPPPELLRGGTGGDRIRSGGGQNGREAPENLFVPPLSEFCPPPESLRGWTFLLSPP